MVVDGWYELLVNLFKEMEMGVRGWLRGYGLMQRPVRVILLLLF
jgi:hypothetical protein